MKNDDLHLSHIIIMIIITLPYLILFELKKFKNNIKKVLLSNNNKKFIGVNKWKMTIGWSWIGIFGMGLLIAQGIQEYISIPIYYLFPLGIFTLWFTGHSLVKTGLYGQEQKFAFEENPFFNKK